MPDKRKPPRTAIRGGMLVSAKTTLRHSVTRSSTRCHRESPERHYPRPDGHPDGPNIIRDNTKARPLTRGTCPSEGLSNNERTSRQVLPMTARHGGEGLPNLGPPTRGRPIRSSLRMGHRAVRTYRQCAGVMTGAPGDESPVRHTARCLESRGPVRHHHEPFAGPAGASRSALPTPPSPAEDRPAWSVGRERGRLAPETGGGGGGWVGRNRHPPSPPHAGATPPRRPEDVTIHRGSPREGGRGTHDRPQHQAPRPRRSGGLRRALGRFRPGPRTRPSPRGRPRSPAAPTTGATGPPWAG